MAFKLPGKSMTAGTSEHKSALKFVGTAAAITAAMALKNKLKKEAAKKSEGGDTEYKTKEEKKAKTTKKSTKPYVKPGGKATGKMKDYAIGSKERAQEYTRRGWAQDATTKSGVEQIKREKAEAKKVARDTGTTEKGKVELSSKGTPESLIEDYESPGVEKKVRGLGRKKGKTLSKIQKAKEKRNIARHDVIIKAAKKEGDKMMRDAGQLKKAEIKSGKYNKYTGTRLSRWVAKQKVKRNKRQIEKRLKKKAEEGGSEYTVS